MTYGSEGLWHYGKGPGKGGWRCYNGIGWETCKGGRIYGFGKEWKKAEWMERTVMCYFFSLEFCVMLIENWRMSLFEKGKKGKRRKIHAIIS